MAMQIFGVDTIDASKGEAASLLASMMLDKARESGCSGKMRLRPYHGGGALVVTDSRETLIDALDAMPVLEECVDGMPVKRLTVEWEAFA